MDEEFSARRGGAPAALRRWLPALLLLAIAAVVGYVLWQAWAAATVAVHPPRDPLTIRLSDYGVTGEDVVFETSDGLTMRGWFIPPASDDRAAVIVQGGHAAFRPDVITNTLLMARHGYGVLTFDWRGTGESDGDTVTMGLHEQRDIRAARAWLAVRRDVDQARVGALAQSAGAAALLMAAADDPSIAAIVAETTFSSVEEMMAAGVRAKFGLPAFPFAPLIVFFGQLQAGAAIDGIRPVDHIGRIAPRPILLIRAGRDDWVPADNADALLAAAGEPKELWDVPEARHSKCIVADPAGYERRVIGFFDRHLRGDPTAGD